MSFSRLAAMAVLSLLGVAGGAFAPRPALAHPHAWIDVTVEVLFDPAGRVTGLRQTWLFDDYYTAFATEGFDRNRDGVPDRDKLDALLAENLSNLAEYDYFTRITADGRKLALSPPTEASSRMRGKRLEMTFRLPLTAPAPAGQGVEYSVFDPTFYIELLHAEGGGAVTLVGAPEGCRHHLIAPTPNPETVMLAQALDRTQSAGDTLGASFAERVEIRCGR